jgi:hypothetical protein
MVKLSKARQRGLWPEHGPIGYGDRPRVEVAISMDRDEYEWLARFVRTNGHVWCVEDALNKAVTAMRGEEPMAHFAYGIAWQHDISASTLLFRPHDEPAAKAVDRLYMAALFVAEVSRTSMFHFVRDDNLPPPDVLALAQAALGEDLDLQAEIERARKEWDAELADMEAEAHKEARKRQDDSPDDADLSGEDDIPF